MFQVEKRDGTIAEFQMKKITDAIGKAFGAKDMQFSDDMLQMLALRVTADFQSKIKDGKISVEAIQDSVENVLIQCGYAEVAKAYILYRKQREKIRNMKSTILDYKEVVDSYVKVTDWRVKENSTVTYSVGGLILSNSGAITANYWLSEIYDEDGRLNRVAILTTNSCTNIKTYANLKYINQLYMKDRFLMIRDSDGKDRDMLGRQLCKYYDERNLVDVDHLPKVTRKNVLILKYYSFENYFLNPEIMSKLGVIESEDAFYEILYDKWREYLHRIKSGVHLIQMMGRDFTSPQDMKEHMEEIKTYMRGHNLFDIFYGRYKKEEKDLLKKYIEIAPRDEFSDILDAADSFIYFQSKTKQKDIQNETK